MHYVGCDIHKRNSHFQHILEDGTLGSSMNLPTCSSSFDSFLSQLPAAATLTIEAGRNHWWISQYLIDHPKVEQVNVVDARRSRKIAEELAVQSGYGRAKTDRIDAEMLAELTRLGILPRIHLPTVQELEFRSICRYRFQLAGDKTISANRLQGLLAMHGVNIKTATLLKEYASQAPYLARLPEEVLWIIGNLLSQIRLCQLLIKRCDRRLTTLLPESHPQVKLLLTVPGIGIVCARIIVTEIFSIQYFKDHRYLISYSGLAPILQESAGRKKVIKLNRHCNYYLKYAFVTAAHAARKHPKYQDKYQQDVKKHGKIIAKLNLARRLAKAVYWMLARQQPFKE